MRAGSVTRHLAASHRDDAVQRVVELRRLRNGCCRALSSPASEVLGPISRHSDKVAALLSCPGKTAGARGGAVMERNGGAGRGSPRWSMTSKTVGTRYGRRLASLSPTQAVSVDVRKRLQDARRSRDAAQNDVSGAAHRTDLEIPQIAAAPVSNKSRPCAGYDGIKGEIVRHLDAVI